MRADKELRELANRQHGHITFEQARALGLSSEEIDRLARSGLWTRASDRVLRLSGAPAARGDRLSLAHLDAGGDAAVSHDAASWWWGVSGFSARHVQLVTTSRSHRESGLAVVHRVRRLPEQWVTTLDDVRVVRPELLVLQLCATVHPDRAARALDNLWRDRLLSGPSLERFLGSMAKRGRNGVTVLRALLAERGPGYVPPASNLERRATDVFGELGLVLRRQVDSGDDECWTGRVDLRDARYPLIIEVQSEKYHSALLDVEADGRRKEALMQAGFVVVEVTDVELWTTPAIARARVAEGLVRVRRQITRA
jgi:hypothetical protein